MMRVVIPMAEGVEEMEAVIVADMLRRARWEVVLAGLAPGLVTASRGVSIQPDAVWDDIDPDGFDLIVLPGGGGGADRLKADERILEALRAFAASGRWVAAICAAPAALHAAGILHGRRATCYPGVEAGLRDTEWCSDRVVIDGKIITSQGPGTAITFALTLIRLIDGDAAANQVASGMLLA